MTQNFQIHNFPKFQRYCFKKRYEYYDEALRTEGFKSAGYNEEKDHHFMEGAEFTMFALVWA